MSKLDKFVRQIVLTSFWSGGWGSYEHLSKIVYYRRRWVSNRETCLQFVPDSYPVQIDKKHEFKDHSILEGSFLTPFANHLPEIMPEEIKRARFQFIIPHKWRDSKNKPVVFHFAGTGDTGYTRRRVVLARPLMHEYSVASILIENPYYGSRKPKNQTRTNLVYVKDLFVLGACLITECLVLMKWCEKMGYGPFVLTGLSMGGYMACLSSTVWPKPLGLVPCLSWTTASSVYTRGVMSKAIHWKVLEEQYFANKEYQELRDVVKEIQVDENKKRQPTRKRVCAFNDPEIKFNELTNYNTSNGKPPVKKEVLEFMHLLLEECTHMVNYDMPYDTSLVHVVAANDDCYVLRDGVNDFTSIWPGCEVEYIKGQGHVSAFLFSQLKFRQTIMNTLDKMINKYQMNLNTDIKT